MPEEDEPEKWKAVEEMLSARFGKNPDLEAVLFLIGIQELGRGGKGFTKEQKQDLMHVAICTVLSDSGYYRLDHYDEDGWPHFTELKKMQAMPVKEQEYFLKQHIIRYFAKKNLLPNVDNRSAKP